MVNAECPGRKNPDKDVDRLGGPLHKYAVNKSATSTAWADRRPSEGMKPGLEIANFYSLALPLPQEPPEPGIKQEYNADNVYERYILQEYNYNPPHHGPTYLNI